MGLDDEDPKGLQIRRLVTIVIIVELFLLIRILILFFFFVFINIIIIVVLFIVIFVILVIFVNFFFLSFGNAFGNVECFTNRTGQILKSKVENGLIGQTSTRLRTEQTSMASLGSPRFRNS